MRLLFRVFIFLIICSLSAQAHNRKYIKKYKPLAKSFAKEYKIPYRFILAVAVMETEGGRSKVCKKLNNHFGIKGKNQVKWKTKYKQFSSAKASYRFFCNIVKKRKFYNRLKGKQNPALWVNELAKTGYAYNSIQWKKNLRTILKTL